MGFINDNQIKTIFEIDRSGELFKRLLNIFETDIPKFILSLEQAINAKDYSIAKKISHSIKSSSLNMGATELANVASNFETFDTTKEVDPAVIEEFHQCFQYSLTELQSYLNLCKS